MKKLILALSLFSTISAFSQVIPISTARNTSLGSTVTVSGVVTNGSEFGQIRYLQDGTAGIAAYGGSVGSINRGDSITVTGPLTEFSGLLEIGTGQAGGNPTYINHGPAVIQPQPLTVPITAINELVEGQLVVVNNVNFTTTGTFPTNGTGNNLVVTNGTNNLNVRINTSTNIDGTPIPTGTVSITGIVSQFNSDYQLIPRDLNDITTYVAPDREINVLVNGATQLSGTTAYLGASTSATIVIENLGVGNLNVSNVVITGAQQSAFTSNIATGNLGPNSTNPYTLTITPTTAGTQDATLTITSNDADEANYVIHFQAAGTDGFATQPTANPSSITFTTNKAYKIIGEYPTSNGASQYLVLWNNGAAVNGVPVDGQSYKRGDVIGNAKVAYVGSATTFTPRGIIANQNYHFAVFAFNGSNGIENYLTTNPTVANVTSNGQEIGNFYNAVSTDAATFPADLRNVINPHTYITYYNFLQTNVNNFALKDTTNGRSYIECMYSGHKEVFDGTFTWSDAQFSREHVYAHSWMPGNPYNDPEKPVYADQHNLFPVRMPNVNAVRSNYPFGNVINASNTYLGTKKGTNAVGQDVYEPRDEIKGDVARALMYMASSYNTTNGFNWGFRDTISIWTMPYGQDPAVILQWHFQDLPDDYEIARNEYIYSVQGNRNPFIDSVHFACHINFKNMSYIAEACGSVSIEEVVTDKNISIYPVPAKESLNLVIDNATISSIELIDLQGRTILTKEGNNANLVTIPVSEITAGTYLVNVVTAKGSITKKVIIE